MDWLSPALRSDTSCFTLGMPCPRPGPWNRRCRRLVLLLPGAPLRHPPRLQLSLDRGEQGATGQTGRLGVLCQVLDDDIDLADAGEILALDVRLESSRRRKHQRHDNDRRHTRRVTNRHQFPPHHAEPTVDGTR